MLFTARHDLIIFLIVLSLAGNTLLAQDSTHAVKLGIDRLVEDDFAAIDGKNIAILTNYTGRNSKGELTARILIEHNRAAVKFIMTPEHGFYSAVPAGESVHDDVIYGVETISLYGKNRKPPKGILERIDAVVVDLQDIGIRSYTFLSTLFNVMDACADEGKEVIILDRPNPIGGLIIDGAVLEPGMNSFVGIIPVPYLHGCTFGELANMINNEKWLTSVKKCQLRVIQMENWERWMSWEDTGLCWIPTSPNIPGIDAIRGAAILGIYGELGIFSIGMGTSLPFQYLGLPGFQADSINEDLINMDFDGIRTIVTKYKPATGKFAGMECSGILLRFPLSNLFRPYSIGLNLVNIVKRHHPELFELNQGKSMSFDMFDKVTGTHELSREIFSSNEIDVEKFASAGLDEYLSLRQKYLLY